MSGFTMNINSLVQGLTNLDTRANEAALMYAQTQASNLESYAKQNRPWTDRTSAAKQRLTGRAFNTTNGVRIELAHGVDYGVWLELANEKKYAIIEPTIRLKGPEVIEGFTNLMDRIGHR